VIACIRFLTLNPGRFCRCRSAERVSAQANSLLGLQIIAKPSILSLRSDQGKSPGALHAAQSLHLSPRVTIDAERSPPKSP